MTRKLLVLALAALSGCATTYEGRYAEAGRATVNPDRSVTFQRSSDFKQPQGFTLAPEEVAAKFGHLCKAKQACTYFADSRSYYLVADYGQATQRPGNIAQAACPVVDGAKGLVLKLC